MVLTFTGFAGASLQQHPLLLPEGVGVDSLNQRPGRGDLRPWKAPSAVTTVASGTLTIYRMGRTAPSDTLYWLRWSADVDVARGFIAEDTSERTFWTGDGVPKWTDNSIGLGALPYPDSSGVRLLGVPKPNATPSLTETVAGAGTSEARAYVVTWVNDRGEESMPSTADTITTTPGSTIRVTRNATVPSGAYGLTTWRVYRTVAGGENDYYYVGEALVAATFLDTTDGTLNTASPLLSETWEMPPATLKGLKTLWNGMMAGFVGKALYFCEPFRPFAWPTGYMLILDDDIVGLGRWRNNLVVVTTGRPVIVTGSNPESMTPVPIEFNQAGLAKLGIVDFGHGVAWPSPDGLAYMGDGGARLLTNPTPTQGIALRDDWQGLDPATMIAAEYEGMYLCSYDPVGAGARQSFALDPLNPSGFYFCIAPFTAAYRDSISDALFVVNGTNIEKWNAGSAMTASHTSKLARVPRPTTFGHCQVLADAYPITLTIWADGTAVATNHSVTSKAPFRLPAGFLADQWQVKPSTAGAVQAVFLAGSSAELNNS